MEQHPVPQHIASFEFKLFGNMTVRQFVTLAIPMSLAAAIFFSGLPSLIRYPLSLVIGLFAFFAALVPINGRPLDKWFVSFIRAIMSPTQRVWVKEPKIPEFLSIVTAPQPTEEKIPETITTQGRERLRAYLRSLPKGTFTPLDVKEQIAVERIGLEGLSPGAQTFGGKLPPPIIWPTSPVSLPQITPMANLSTAQARAATTMSQPKEEEYEGAMEEALPPPQTTRIITSPKIPAHAQAFALPGLEKKLQKSRGIEHVELTPAPRQVLAQLASEENAAVENIISYQTPNNQIKLIHGIGKTRVRKLHFAPPEGFELSKLPIRGEKRFEISQELKKRFSFDQNLFAETSKLPLQPTVSPKPPEPQPANHQEFNRQASIPKETHFIPKPKTATQPHSDVSLKKETREDLEAKISISGQKTPTVPLPQISRAQIVPLTSTPNVISGIVTDQVGNPIENVILTLKDANGIPVRALKTNKLGQYLSATPLGNGSYTIEVESEQNFFTPLTINLTGQVLMPMEIKAKS